MAGRQRLSRKGGAYDPGVTASSSRAVSCAGDHLTQGALGLAELALSAPASAPASATTQGT